LAVARNAALDRGQRRRPAPGGEAAAQDEHRKTEWHAVLRMTVGPACRAGLAAPKGPARQAGPTDAALFPGKPANGAAAAAQLQVQRVAALRFRVFDAHRGRAVLAVADQVRAVLARPEER